MHLNIIKPLRREELQIIERLPQLISSFSKGYVNYEHFRRHMFHLTNNSSYDSQKRPRRHSTRIFWGLKKKNYTQVVILFMSILFRFSFLKLMLYHLSHHHLHHAHMVFHHIHTFFHIHIHRHCAAFFFHYAV